MARACRGAQSSRQLFLSDGTVKWHLRSVRAKLGVTNSWDHAELRARPEEAGALDDDRGLEPPQD